MSDEPPEIPTETPIRQFPIRPSEKTEQVVEPAADTAKPVSPFTKFTGIKSTNSAELTAEALRADRRRKAYELWLWNTPFEQIAKVTGVSIATAFKDVTRHQRELDKLNPHGVEVTRKKLVNQAERAMRALAPKVAAGDTKAHEAYSQHADRVARLMGAYAPVKVAATNVDGDAWAPIAVTMLQQLSNAELELLAKLADKRLLPAPAADQPVIDVNAVVGVKR